MAYDSALTARYSKNLTSWPVISDASYQLQSQALKMKVLTGRRIFQLYRIQFSNTGAYEGLYTWLSQLSWRLQRLPVHSSRRFQHDLTVARRCYVTETEYFLRFHEFPWVSISWIDAFPLSSEHFHEVPTERTPGRARHRQARPRFEEVLCLLEINGLDLAKMIKVLKVIYWHRYE